MEGAIGFIGLGTGAGRSALAPRRRQRRPSTCRQGTAARCCADERGTGDITVSPVERRGWGAVDAPSSFRVRHVLVASEEMCDFVLEEARRAGSQALQEYAASLSVCAVSRKRGGDLGWYTAEDFPYRDVAHLLGEMRPNSGVHKVRSSAGWHALAVEDARTAIELTAFHPARTFRRAGQNLGKVRKFRKEADWRTYFIETHGCQMNKSDTERMAGELEGMGLTPVDAPKAADVVVFNTCSIREHAEHKVYSQLGPLAQRKWTHPHIALVVAGCVAQQEGERLARRVPEVDLIMGPQYANRLSELLLHVARGNQVVATEDAHIAEDASEAVRAEGVTAWVNIIYGCNERCTYCVVPNTRGIEQSRPPEAVRAEMEALARQGYREVTLLGQNTDAYGRDLTPRVTFTDLLRHVHDVEGIERIRFTTSHPRYFSKRLSEACAELPKVCESFNVPFQSGDDEVLRAMNRGYTVRRYRQVIAQIRERIPDASITADAIVGFPGETEEQFENTLRLMEDLQFDHVHTAAYSPRPSTPAAVMELQVDDAEKERRLQRINAQNEKDSLARNQRYLGRTLEVLVTGTNPRNSREVSGRTGTNRVTYFEGDIAQLRGKLVPVLIREARTFTLSGVQNGDPR